MRASWLVFALLLCSCFASVGAFAEVQLSRSDVRYTSVKRKINGQTEFFQVRLRTGERIGLRGNGVSYHSGAHLLCVLLGFETGIPIGVYDGAYSMDSQVLTLLGHGMVGVGRHTSSGTALKDVRCSSYPPAARDADVLNVERYLRAKHRYGW
jgi:hypothetical protein